MNLYIGLMSGTSMDGIDAALVDVSKNQLLLGCTLSYSDLLKHQINSLLDGSDLSFASLCHVNTFIGREFAGAVKMLLQEAQLFSKDICAIGSHGQTVCHNTNDATPYTLQLGCPHTIAALTGITVVADFRTRDLVLGGQGAPFAPIYHQELFKKEKTPLAVVNVGGIANISLIHPNEPTKGWDVGPGNCLMDAWILKHQGKHYDVCGHWAQQGEVISPLLTALMADPFLHQAAPKSIGKEYFSLAWLEGYLRSDYKPVNIQKTLLAFTAQSIADSLLKEATPVKNLYLCGGGAHNLALLEALSQMLPEVIVNSTAAIDLSPDHLEAMMFAWLASQTINSIPIDLRTITGSTQPLLLGAIYPTIKNDQVSG